MTRFKIINRKSQIAILVLGFWPLPFEFSSCSSKNAKYQQYFAQGQLLYERNCSNCHQKNGKGLGLVYPPLAASDYLEKNFSHSLCLMKYGTQGEIVVNGKNFNKPMPGVASLTDLEIAEIATYLTNAWGRQQEMVEISQVTKALGECGVK
jgi:mono/diheme cytochrome c family protein